MPELRRQHDLHTSRQCTYFDPGARFECRKTITARIVNKNARNACELFVARSVVERQTGSSSGGGPTNNARQAFANLFKKIRDHLRSFAALLTSPAHSENPIEECRNCGVDPEHVCMTLEMMRVVRYH